MISLLHQQVTSRLLPSAATMPRYLGALKLENIALVPRLLRRMCDTARTTVETLHIGLVGGIASWRLFAASSRRLKTIFPLLRKMNVKADIGRSVIYRMDALIFREEVSSLLSEFGIMTNFELIAVYGKIPTNWSRSGPSLIEHGDWHSVAPGVGRMQICDRSDVIYRRGDPAIDEVD
jgi:hypothetical protein